MSLNKRINPEIPVSIKVFIRACFGLLFLSPIIFKHKLKVFKTNNLKLHLFRVLFTFFAMAGTYYAYTHLPFTIAIAIGFSGPIFTSVLAAFILKDRLSWKQWGAILIGYLGVLIMVNPNGEINNALYIAVAANILTGLSLTFAKRLTAIDSPNTIVIIGSIGIIITSSIWTFSYYMISVHNNTLASLIWQLPSKQDILYLMGMGLLGASSQIAYITALKYSSPSFLSPFEYTRLVIGVPIGITLGEMFPGYQEWIGIAIIVCSTFYMSLNGKKNAT